MEHKLFPSFLIKTDAEQGIAEAIVAVMGNLDEGDDIIGNGAFLKSIQERAGKITVLDQHNTDSVLRVLGHPLEIRELARDQLPADLLAHYPDATGGLYTKTQYNLKTDNGRNIFHLIAAGDIKQYSIGYDPLDKDYSKFLRNGESVTARNLRTVKLWEYSPAIFGMNSEI